MRRGLALLIVLAPFAWLTAQDPKKDAAPLTLPTVEIPVEKVREERIKLAKEREASKAADIDDEAAAERRALRKKLDELLERLNQKPAPPAKPAETKGPNPKVVGEPTTPKAPTLPTDPRPTLDAVGNAAALYLSDDIEAALNALRLMPMESVTPEEAVFVRYMTACCHRRLNQLTEAYTLFSEVANTAPAGSFLKECAVWQAKMIGWRRDTERQLSELRQKREAVPAK